MEIKIDSREILTSDEVKEIASEEVRAQVRNYFEGEGKPRKEGHVDRLHSNSAHRIIIEDVYKIVSNYENEIATKERKRCKNLTQHTIYGGKKMRGNPKRALRNRYSRTK